LPRVKRGVAAHKRHKSVLKLTKGQVGARSKLYRRANEARMKSLAYAYRDRRNRKRDMRRLWIVRINAAARQNGLAYSRFMRGLQLAGVDLNRKVLADMAITDPKAFATLVDTARGALV
jgi:large subunit ribosomal protein L20